MFTLDPSTEGFLKILEFLLKFVGGIGAFYLFIIGLRRYEKDQTWKRNEFVAKEIKEFSSDKIVRNTMYMIDWGTRNIELFPDKPIYDERFVKVDREILKMALQYHQFRKKVPGEIRYSPTEVAIRDHFDHFLFYLERFEHFIETKLISSDELKPYLKYWLEAIADKMDPEARNALFNYINKYEFSGVEALFNRYGKDIKPK